MKRICLWSGPRNISTALMYAFAQRSDTTVVDEPLYAHYLTSTPSRDYHPGALDVIAHQENHGPTVVDTVLLGPYPTPVVFFKHMTHHLVDLDWAFLQHTTNLILTRDPGQMLTSFINQIPNPTLQDTGYPQQLQLLRHLQSIGQSPLVIDSTHILLDPPKTPPPICAHLQIPFQPAMLRWPAGPRPEDGIWAPHWYHNVHRSTGFAPYKPKTTPIPDSLADLHRECQQLYNALIAPAS